MTYSFIFLVNIYIIIIATIEKLQKIHFTLEA